MNEELNRLKISLHTKENFLMRDRNNLCRACYYKKMMEITGLRYQVRRLERNIRREEENRVNIEPIKNIKPHGM